MTAANLEYKTNVWTQLQKSRWTPNAERVMGQIPHGSNEQSAYKTWELEPMELSEEQQQATISRVPSVRTPTVPHKAKNRMRFFSSIVSKVSNLWSPKKPVDNAVQTQPIVSELQRINAIVAHYESGKTEFAYRLIHLQKQHSKNKQILNNEEKTLLHHPEHRLLKQKFAKIMREALTKEKPTTQPSTSTPQTKETKNARLGTNTITDADYQNTIVGRQLSIKHSETPAQTNETNNNQTSSKPNTTNPVSRIKGIASIYQSGNKELAYKLVRLGQERSTHKQIISSAEKTLLDKSENRQLKQQFSKITQEAIPDIKRVHDTIEAYENKDFKTAHRLSKEFPKHAMGYLRQNSDQMHAFVKAKKAADTWMAAKLTA